MTALLLMLLNTGCALGAGGGMGVTVNTKGSVGVLASAHIYPWGVRMEPKETQGEETAFFLMPVEVSSGIMFNPGQTVLRIDMPFMGFTTDSIEAGQGFSGSLNPRFELLWPWGEGELRSAFGVAAHVAWMQHLLSTQLERVASRPEWPDGWEIHQFGPAFDGALMYRDEGEFYGTFTLSGIYRYLTYFYMGL